MWPSLGPAAGLADEGFTNPLLNNHQESRRALVEHVIGKVKEKFSVLQHLRRHKLIEHGAIFGVCCALYNRQLRLYGPRGGM